MNIVCLGQQGWHVTRTAKQHLLTRLARRGHRVLYVDPIAPDAGGASLSTPTRFVGDVWPPSSGNGLRQVGPGLHVLTLPAPKLPRAIATRLPPRVVRGVTERVGCWAPVVITSWPASRWLADRIDASARVVLAFDDNSAFGNMPASFVEHQRREQKLALEQSHVALAVSPELVEQFKQIQPHTYLQENGVEVDDFSPAALASSPRHAIFDRIDADLPRRGRGRLCRAGRRADGPMARGNARQASP